LQQVALELANALAATINRVAALNSTAVIFFICFLLEM